MWQRYSLYDFRAIAHYLGVLVFFTGAAMLAPVALAAALGEWEPASRYLFSAGVALLLGALLRMVRVQPGRLSRQQAIAVTSFAWVVIALVAAIPLALSAHYSTYFDAFFDAVSMSTTTGVSIISGADHLSMADNMWRFIVVYAGGLGLIVVALSFGLFGGVSDSSLYESEGRSEHVLPNVVETARFILKFSVAVIVAASLVVAGVLWLAGVEPVHAALHGLWLSISSFMTVGMTPMSTNVAYYHSIVVEVVLMLLMLLGSINFGLQSEVLRGRVKAFFKDVEIRTAQLWIAVMLVVFMCSLAGSLLLGNLPAMLRTGLFTFLSAATTCGLSVMNSSQMVVVLPSGALLVLAIVMAVGGGAGSTAGGIKLRRVAVIAKSAYETMKTTASPDSARVVTRYFHIGWHKLDSAEVKEAMTVFILFVITYIIGALAGIAFGFDAVSAITESVAMASNGGLSAGIATAATPLGLKIVYILEMWAGRLEFVALIAVAIKIAASLRPRLDWFKKRGAR